MRKYRGAFSGEHGDGLCRGEWIRWQFGPVLDDALREIKQTFDPSGLFNPGKIIDPPKMDDVSLMRFAPPSSSRPYQRIPITPVLDWSAWNVQNDPVTEQTTAPGTGGDVTGGLAKAVEMCNNNGHCRKFDAGTMCPSYRVTRDEQHLTRGRANTLRLALSGQLGLDAFTSDAMHETMDLCVGCKGCKRDCPTGVDMAKMKIEFLAHYKARHGWTLKDRLVAGLPDYAALASRFPSLMNLRNRVPALARLTEQFTGLSAQRSLPTWRSDTFWRDDLTRAGFISRDEALAREGRGERVAVLFVDTFNGTFESDNARSAARVLQAAGYALHTVTKDGGHHCCGRTYLASGQVEKAKARAGALIDALLPLAQAGIAVVGLEPSCLLTLRDEALVMGLGHKAHVVAGPGLAVRRVHRPRGGSRSLPGAVQAGAGTCAAARALPPESVRRGATGDGRAQAHPRCPTRADRNLLLWHGWQLWLRSRAPLGVHADGRGGAATRHSQTARRYRRGRRHQLPPPDCRRRPAEGRARGAAACGFAAGWFRPGSSQVQGRSTNLKTVTLWLPPSSRSFLVARTMP